MDAQNSEPRVAVECELKFALTAEAVEKIKSCPILHAQNARSETLLSTYFDTSQYLLGKSGLSLRLRRSEGSILQTLKRESRASTGLFVRPEYETVVSDAHPDLDHLRRHCPVKLPGGANLKLEAVFSVDVKRINWPMRWKGGEVNISLDDGVIRTGERRMPVRELEIELRRGEIGPAFDLATRLVEIAPLRLETASKAERGYRLLQHHPADHWRPTAVLLSRDATFSDVFRMLSLHCLNHFSANEALFLESPSAENVHQMRVALRRFLSLLSVCKPALKREYTAEIRFKIKRVFRELGKARDLDVAIEALRREKRHGEPAILIDLNRKRESAHRRIRRLLCSRRVSRDMIEILYLIATGLESSPSSVKQAPFAMQPLTKIASDLLDRQWEKLRRFDSVSQLGRKERHNLRSQAKRFRYACEFFESLYPAPKQMRQRNRLATHLEHIQDYLGRLNDLASLNHLMSKAGSTSSIENHKRLRRHLMQAASRAQDALLEQRVFWH